MNAIKCRVSSYVRTSQQHVNVHPQTSCVTFPNNSWYCIHLLPLQKFHTIITPTGSSESLQHSSIPLLVYSLGIKHWMVQSTAPSPPPNTQHTHAHNTHTYLQFLSLLLHSFDKGLKCLQNKANRSYRT